MVLIGYPLGKRVRPFRAAAFFQHRLTGAHELPQAGSPYPGGEVFAEPQRGVRLPGGGTRG